MDVSCLGDATRVHQVWAEQHLAPRVQLVEVVIGRRDVVAAVLTEIVDQDGHRATRDSPDAIDDALAVAHGLDAELAAVVEVAIAAGADHGRAAMLGQLRLDAPDASVGGGDHDRVVRTDRERVQGVQRGGAREEEAARRLLAERLGLGDDRGDLGPICRRVVGSLA